MLAVRTPLLACIIGSLLSNAGNAQPLEQEWRAEIKDVVREYLRDNPAEVQQIVKDYLVKRPEILQEALLELMKGRPLAAKGPSDKAAIIKSNAATIFSSIHQVTLGRPQADISLVQFFDYNCGFCKRALSDTIDLLKQRPNLRIVLKEFPILGPGSTEASQVAVAVRMQDPSGEQYLAFHERLMRNRGHTDRAIALEVARETGLDMVRLERDLGSDEIAVTLQESRRLASLLGINGTPSYVVGDQVMVGAVGIATLNERINAIQK